MENSVCSQESRIRICAISSTQQNIEGHGQKVWERQRGRQRRRLTKIRALRSEEPDEPEGGKDNA